MFIKKLKPGVFDVFVGTQWDQWTRVQRVGNSIRYLAGQYMSRDTFMQVKEYLCSGGKR